MLIPHHMMCLHQSLTIVLLSSKYTIIFYYHFWYIHVHKQKDKSNGKETYTCTCIQQLYLKFQPYQHSWLSSHFPKECHAYDKFDKDIASHHHEQWTDLSENSRNPTVCKQSHTKKQNKINHTMKWNGRIKSKIKTKQSKSKTK